jgi:hypothetical protein
LLDVVGRLALLEVGFGHTHLGQWRSWAAYGCTFSNAWFQSNGETLSDIVDTFYQIMLDDNEFIINNYFNTMVDIMC